MYNHSEIDKIIRGFRDVLEDTNMDESNVKELNGIDNTGHNNVKKGNRFLIQKYPKDENYQMSNKTFKVTFDTLCALNALKKFFINSDGSIVTADDGLSYVIYDFIQKNLTVKEKEKFYMLYDIEKGN